MRAHERAGQHQFDAEVQPAHAGGRRAGLFDAALGERALGVRMRPLGAIACLTMAQE